MGNPRRVSPPKKLCNKDIKVGMRILVLDEYNGNQTTIDIISKAIRKSVTEFAPGCNLFFVGRIVNTTSKRLLSSVGRDADFGITHNDKMKIYDEYEYIEFHRNFKTWLRRMSLTIGKRKTF